MTTEYRSATPTDLPEVRALAADCALPVDDLTEALLRYFVLARERGRLVGVAGLELVGREGLLRSLAVAANHRGRGIGERLCDEAEAAACNLGLQRLYLLTTTAAAYFAQRGFRRIERSAIPLALQQTAEFSHLCPASAVCMEKKLREG